MYPLLPWKWLGGGLAAVVMIAVSADNLARLMGTTVSDQSIVRYVPLAVVTILGGFFGPTGYWAPWRVVWRLCPALNQVDLPRPERRLGWLHLLQLADGFQNA